MRTQEFKIDIAVGIVSIIVGITAFVLAMPFPGRASLFPKLVSVLFCILGGGLVAVSFRKLVSGTESTKPVLSLETFKWPALVFFFLGVYVLVMQNIGFYVTTPIMLVVSMRIMGIKSVKTIVFATIAMMLFVFLLFTVALGIPLPEGILR